MTNDPYSQPYDGPAVARVDAADLEELPDVEVSDREDREIRGLIHLDEFEQSVRRLVKVSCRVVDEFEREGGRPNPETISALRAAVKEMNAAGIASE